MAKKKYYPVIRKFDITGGSNTFTICDTMKEMSRLNHRLYRQTRIPTVNVRLRQDSALPAVDVYALRTDWMLCNSVKMAFEQYRAATAETRAVMSKKQIARWEDFRINHGLSPVNEASSILYTYNLTGSPQVIGRTNMTTGEFQLTEVEDDSGVTHTFTLGAAATNEYNIIAEYDKAADTDSAPSNTVSSGDLPYAGLDDDIDATIKADLEQRGNDPPYDSDSLQPDSPWVRVGTIGVGAAHSTLSTGQFEAPLGLVLLGGYTYAGSGESSEEGNISIEIKAGDYKGVHAPSMV